MPRSVNVASLGVRTVLGSGGQGTVYAVAGRLIDGTWPAAYKEFSVPVNASALTAMVAFRDALPPDLARGMGEVAAWPATIVERDGHPCGFLMRRAPDEFETDMEFPSGPSRRLARVELLLNDDTYLTARALRIDDRFRLELLHDTARVIDLLHRLGVVVGDLSPNNVLFTRDRRPRCFFLDCDGMRLRGASVLRAAETVDWHAPPGEGSDATPATDSYKFALLCIRLFAGDQSSRDPAVLARAGARLRALAENALAADPRRRPGMDQWCAALAAAVVRNRIGLVAAPAGGRPLRRRAVAVALAAVLLVLVAALATCALVGNAAGTFTGDDRPGAAEQASGLAQVVADSVAIRAPAASAVHEVALCTDLYTAVADLRIGADRRTALVERARDLSTDLLPNGSELKTELVTALDHRRLADEAYAAWAAAVQRTGCESPAMLGPQRRAGESEDQTAAVAAGRFAQLWNPIADRYGHRRVSGQDM
jgi:hypothetical protein